MKKVGRDIKRMLSVLLAAAMIVTCIPQTAFSVMAAGNAQVDDSYGVSPNGDAQEVLQSENEDDNTDIVTEDEEQSDQDKADEDELTDPSENEGSEEEVPSESEDEGTETPSENTDGEEEAPVEDDEILVGEESGEELSDEDIEVYVDEINANGAEMDDEDSSAEEYTVMIDYLPHPSTERNYLGTPSYAVGDSDGSKFSRYRPEGIKVPKGAKLRLQFSGMALGYSVKLSVDGKDESEILYSRADIFTIESVESNITIKADPCEIKFLLLEDPGNSKKVTVTFKGAGYVEEGSFDESGSKIKIKKIKANNSFMINIRGKKPAKGETLADAEEFRKGIDRVESVAYQCGDGELVYFDIMEKQWDVANKSLGLTVPADAVKGDITIYVKTGEIPKHDVTFTYDAERVSVKWGRSSDAISKSPEDAESLYMREGTGIATKESKLYFSAKVNTKNENARKYFKITGATAHYDDGTEVLVHSTNTPGTYWMNDVKGDVNIVVSRALDEAKCQNLSIEADANEHDDVFKVSIDGFTAGDDDEGLNKKYVAGDRVLTQSTELTAAIEVDDDYRLDRVELDDGVELKASEDGKYAVAFGNNKKKTLKVYTTPKEFEGDIAKTVSFIRDDSFAGKLEGQLKVAVSEQIKQQDGAEQTYRITKGATYFNFDLTVDGSEYDPVVTYKDATGNDVAKPLSPRSSTGNIYSYSVAANRLPDNVQISIGEKYIDKEVRVAYEPDEAAIVSAKIGLKELEQKPDQELNQGGWFEERTGVRIYRIPRGKTVTFNVRARDYCKLLSVETNIGGEEKAVKPEEASHNFSVTATDNAYVYITSEGICRVKPLQEIEGQALTPTGGVYKVNVNKEYSMGLLRGLDTIEYYDSAEVRINGTLVYTDIDGYIDESVEEDINVRGRGGDFILGLKDNMANKQINVALYWLEYDEVKDRDNKILAASYTMKVGPLLSGVSVEGVSSNKLSQTIHTVKSYKVTPKPAGSDLSGVEVKVEAGGEESKPESGVPEAVKAELSDGMLTITTGEKLGESANVVLYIPDDSESGEQLLSFMVTTNSQLGDKTPGVSLKSARDTSLTLTLSAPKGVEMPSEGYPGYLYYKVEAAAQKAPESAEEKSSAKGGTWYFEKKEGTSQNETIKVIEELDGHGYLYNFDVTVTLVRSKGSIDENGSNVQEAVIIDNSLTSTSKPFATKKPYYEDNLKLKKGTTTVYTGQENIVVAIPQFGKNTTFTEITAEDLTYGESKGALKIGNTANDTPYGDHKADEDGNVIVSAIPVIGKDGKDTNNQTALGKHTIEVIASAPELMYASRATIVVTVVRGVEKLEVDVPSVSMYKAGKKAATLKATVQYNPELGVTDNAPKAKKVTWDVVTADEAGKPLKGSGTRMDGMVTIKNGTVTVNKNYVLSAKDEENRFMIKVTAADYKGSPVTAYSDPILITDEPMTIGDVAIVRRTDNGAEVIARNEVPVKELEAEELKDARIMAFVKDAPVRNSYTSSEISQYAVGGNVSYKSSSAKAVSIVDDQGAIKVLKTAKKVKLTVTANDGSKATKSMTVTVGYDTARELGLRVEKYDVAKRAYILPNATYTTDIKTIPFTDTTGARFKLRVMQKVGEGWEPITGCTDYKLKVAGAKTVPQADAPAGVVEIVANSKEAKITLTNNSVGAVNTPAVYTLSNSGFEGANSVAAPGVSLLESLIASSETVPAKTVTGKLTGNYGDYSGDARIEVDWTKATAKNRASLEALEQQLNPKGVVKVENGEFKLGFYRNESDKYYSLNAGNYTLKVTLRKKGEEGETFTPYTKPASVTLKVVKPKTASFKMTTSYTIAAEDTGCAVLGGKRSNDVVVTYDRWMNANVKGEGKPNNFITYFDLDKESGTLRLTDAWKNDALFESIKSTDKKHLTGYVSYTARIYANPDAENRDADPANIISEVHGTVKISVNVQKSNKLKYTLAVGNVGTAAGSAVRASVKTGKNPATVAYAVVDKESQGKWDIDANKDGITMIDSSEIILQSADKKDANKKYKVILYIIPKGSYYDTVITKAIKDAQQGTPNELSTDKISGYIADHGIKVSVSITAKDA